MAIAADKIPTTKFHGDSAIELLLREAEVLERLETFRASLESLTDSDVFIGEPDALPAVYALKMAQSDPSVDVVPMLLNALHSPDAEVREYAAEHLRRFPSPRAVTPLLPLLRDESAWVRIETVETLGYLRDPSAIPHLLACATDEEPAVRVNVAEALGAIRDRSPGVVRTLIAMLDDEESVVRAFSAEALGDLGIREAIPALHAHLPDKPVVRVWLYYALARLGQGFHWKGVQRVLRSDQVSSRFQAMVVFRLLATEQNAAKIATLFRRTLKRETSPDLRDTLYECICDMETANPLSISQFSRDTPLQNERE